MVTRRNQNYGQTVEYKISALIDALAFTSNKKQFLEGLDSITKTHSEPIAVTALRRVLQKKASQRQFVFSSLKQNPKLLKKIISGKGSAKAKAYYASFFVGRAAKKISLPLKHYPRKFK